MSSTYCIKNAQYINEGEINSGDIYIKNGRFEKIGGIQSNNSCKEIDFEGLLLCPGIIDDQVHFREPGLTHKANIHSESAAAAAGGVTSFMEMPNTNPPTVTLDRLEEKFQIAQQESVVNYSFFLGASNDNLDVLLSADYRNICGIKIFMGSSTGNLLVDNEKTLDEIFKNAPVLIATHCEDENTILRNLSEYKSKYGDHITPDMHPLIRSEEGCYISSQKAIELAKKHNTRLHILHISTGKEIDLFQNNIPLKDKKITAEACVHHLYYSSDDYNDLGNKIKCNPAIKNKHNRELIRKGLKEGFLDIVATDHAPHTFEEKQLPYLQAPSGLPLVQHSLSMMLDMVQEGIFSLEEVIYWMCHAPAICFKIQDRGFLREGYFADFFQLDVNAYHKISQENIYYKCKWSPLEGKRLPGIVNKTWVNGHLVYNHGSFISGKGSRLTFER